MEVDICICFFIGCVYRLRESVPVCDTDSTGINSNHLWFMNLQMYFSSEPWIDAFELLCCLELMDHIDVSYFSRCWNIFFREAWILFLLNLEQFSSESWNNFHLKLKTFFIWNSFFTLEHCSHETGAIFSWTWNVCSRTFLWIWRSHKKTRSTTREMLAMPWLLCVITSALRLLRLTESTVFMQINAKA